MVLLLDVLCITWLTIAPWQGGVAVKAVIRSSGKIFSEVSLSCNQIISVPGPLGISRIAIHNWQVRIAADPSPRQYCMHQGCLKQAGEIAIYLPDQVSVELSGRGKRYDRLNY